jgi:hypothetical protein
MLYQPLSARLSAIAEKVIPRMGAKCLIFLSLVTPIYPRGTSCGKIVAESLPNY